ncbi:tumor necrosis factor receptor superfamily member 26-like isoform X1 [Cavia porcellus]|uniref:tumor necrosis factor receptor superfamily member 26-like isoform X1 n=1 Tax=Cavia porcellus TaxID=10141 RepID=UPI002FE24E9F
MIRPGRLLILVLVIVATSATTCNPGECLSDTGHCCQCCSAGEHDTKLCQENHGAAECASCESGRTFMAHPNLQPLCSPCSDCRKEDQNPVSNCSLTSDRECQCAENYYCDSEKCVEHCFQCKRYSQEGVLQPPLTACFSLGHSSLSFHIWSVMLGSLSWWNAMPQQTRSAGWLIQRAETGQ